MVRMPYGLNGLPCPRCSVSDADDVLDYLKKASTYHLATVDEDGNPRIRPFGSIAKFEGRPYIRTGKKKAVSRQMHAHPRIEICSLNGGTRLMCMNERKQEKTRETSFGLPRKEP